MNFLNPAILFGLIAAGIPILLHLLNLRKLKKVDFSTLKFLKELQKTKIKKLKLKQIILLILRTLIIIFIVLAFSRPTIQSSLPLMENYAKSTSVILVDNSFSMDLSDEYGNRLNQAKKAAIEIIGNMKEGDEAALIKMASLDERNQFEFTRNLELLQENVEAIKVSHTKAELNQSLTMAANIIGKQQNINKEIYLITDAQNNIFSPSDSMEIKGLNAALYVIPVGYEAKADLGNLSVDSIKVISKIYAADKEVEVEAYVKNNSDSDVNGVVVSMLFNGRRVSQRTTDIPAGETRSVDISAVPNSTGSIKGEIEIEGDPLEIDNRRYFGFMIPENPKIAVYGPKLNYKLLVAAIKGAYKSTEPNIEHFNAGTFSSINFNDYDLIILAQGSPGVNENTRLAEYIANGGALLIFADYQNLDDLKDLASKTGFGDLKQLAFSENSPGVFTSVDRQHPIFEGVFQNENSDNDIVESANVYSAFAPQQGQAIISIPGGVFLAESRLGKGKAFFTAVSADLDMSNYPLTGIYAALSYRSVLYLTALELEGISVQSGDDVYIDIPKKYANETNLKILDPNGNEFYASPVDLPGGTVLIIKNMEIPGVYEVLSSNGEAITNFAVNTENTESYSPDKDSEYFTEQLENKLDETVEIVFLDATENISQSISRARVGTELWQLMLILALLCAAAELFVQKSTKQELS